MVDGATRHRRCGRSCCRWPMPGVIATGIYIFITSWNEYLFALMLAGQQVRTVTVALQPLIGEYQIAVGPADGRRRGRGIAGDAAVHGHPDAPDRRHDPRCRERLNP